MFGDFFGDPNLNKLQRASLTPACVFTVPLTRKMLGASSWDRAPLRETIEAKPEDPVPRDGHLRALIGKDSN